MGTEPMAKKAEILKVVSNPIQSLIAPETMTVIIPTRKLIVI